MIKCAHKTAPLAIAEKLNTIQRLQVCKPEDIDMHITGLEPDDPILASFRENITVPDLANPTILLFFACRGQSK